MNNIATTIEQSRRLLELRLDVKSADMCLCKTAQDTWVLYGYVPNEYDAHTVPAWSLSALLKVMPITITKDGMEHKLKVFPSGLFSTHSDTSKWTVQYCGIDYSYRARDKYPILVAVTQYDLIDAAYEMVCWLLENNLITNN